MRKKNEELPLLCKSRLVFCNQLKMFTVSYHSVILAYKGLVRLTTNFSSTVYTSILSQNTKREKVGKGSKLALILLNRGS